MSKRKRPSHSEDELLEQWDFLDAMVDRQASQLRAGVNDSEDVDDPVAADPAAREQVAALKGQVVSLQTELTALRSERDRWRAELTALQGQRDATVGETTTILRERDQLRSAHEALAAKLTAAAAEVARIRKENHSLAAAAKAPPLPASPSRAPSVSTVSVQNHVVAADTERLQRRVLELETESARHTQRQSELLETLRGAHHEIEALRAAAVQSPKPRRGWWRRGD